MEQPPRLLTVEEANQLLEQAMPLVQQLQRLHASILHTNQQLDDDVQKLSVGNGYPIQELRERIEKLTAAQMKLLEEFQAALQQLETLGCVLKDVSTGLIDFYSLREGEVVCLCWRVGEERIGFWHRLEDGFAGRQPV
mgnify:FL=1